jgi:hypothetical protein
MKEKILKLLPLIVFILTITIYAIIVPVSTCSIAKGSDEQKPILQEEYELLLPQERYGACYHYCIEDMLLCNKEMWEKVYIIRELSKVNLDLQQRLEVCMEGKNQ